MRSLRGESITLPTSDGDARLIHLQFRRFAGCPACNLHVRRIAARIEDLRAANLREIALFHSTAATMLPFQGDLPFEIIADPDKALYRAFGVEASLRSLVDPRAWGGFLRGIVASHPSSSTKGEGGHLGLPADFLIDKDGAIRAVKYGAHANDQWSVDEVLDLARTV